MCKDQKYVVGVQWLCIWTSVKCVIIARPGVCLNWFTEMVWLETHRMLFQPAFPDDSDEMREWVSEWELY